MRVIDGLEEMCEDVTQKMCTFLSVDRPILTSLNLEDRVCEIVAHKVMHILGIKCKYNYKNELIHFFASIIGDVVLDRLGFRFSVAKKFRYVKYNGLNFEREISDIFFSSNSIDLAIIRSINFLEENKKHVADIKQALKMKFLQPVNA